MSFLQKQKIIIKKFQLIVNVWLKETDTVALPIGEYCVYVLQTTIGGVGTNNYKC